MRALRFDRFGDPHVLSLTECPDPTAQHGNAVIAVKAASVNASDVKNVAGRMEGTLLPRIPGRDFSGVVIDGPLTGPGLRCGEPGATSASPAMAHTPSCSPSPPPRSPANPPG
ncbi:alcohol dehydrogenase catalytic domain-containing protein [Streptomyces sp. NPDC052051]|uniref:alcohol dehydrogenase catalytic domain-containing protein n=1 Tax=Streptomyces sp. NPDC052051 TaxID=3154649 RepID=UPI00341A77A4